MKEMFEKLMQDIGLELVFDDDDCIQVAVRPGLAWAFPLRPGLLAPQTKNPHPRGTLVLECLAHQYGAGLAQEMVDAVLYRQSLLEQGVELPALGEE